jgi:hypothetical protein
MNGPVAAQPGASSYALLLKNVLVWNAPKHLQIANSQNSCRVVVAYTWNAMPASADDFPPVRFSTDDLPEQERPPCWREEFARGLLRADIDPLSSSLPFRANATRKILQGMRSAAFAGSAARFQRTRAMAAEGDDSIGLAVNLGNTPRGVRRARRQHSRANEH